MSDLSLLKKTALYEEHQKLGARIVDFGGWAMPVQYTGVIDEHQACRQAAALFDVSHMGEFTFKGKDAEPFLDYLVTNDVTKIKTHQALYTVMCLPKGGVVDDLIIYRKGSQDFLMVVNAANLAKDWDHVQKILKEFREKQGSLDLHIQDDSNETSLLALQGPLAEEILQPLTSIDLHKLSHNDFAEGKFLDIPSVTIACTGYTGEHGYEIFLPWDKAPAAWRALLEKGKDKGLKPCGLAARDTLRTEMKYALYGHEITEETNPFEAGLGWVVKLNKKDFLGKPALEQFKAEGPQRKLVGLQLMEPGVLRQGYPICALDGTHRIGELTSGTFSPSLNKSIGIGYVLTPLSSEGEILTVQVRDKKLRVQIVSTPFYKKNKGSLEGKK